MIRYVIGDATQPIGDGPKVIAHVCNDAGRWGAGFTGALSRRWLGPERYYRKIRRYQLGGFSIVPVEKGLWVANLIAQHGVRLVPGAEPPIRYDAMAFCLGGLADNLLLDWPKSISAHMPRIGCGLAGGTWDRVEPLIQKYLVDRGIDVTVYDLSGAEFKS